MRYEYSFASYSYHFSCTNIFDIHLYLFLCKYNWIFVCLIFLIRIYSDVRLYHIYKYIQIFIHVVFYTNIFKRKNLTSKPKSPKVKWLKLFTQRLIFKGEWLSFCCVNYVLTFCCINHKKPASNIKSNLKPNITLTNLIQTYSYMSRLEV